MSDIFKAHGTADWTPQPPWARPPLKEEQMNTRFYRSNKFWIAAVGTLYGVGMAFLNETPEPWVLTMEEIELAAAPLLAYLGIGKNPVTNFLLNTVLAKLLARSRKK